MVPPSFAPFSFEPPTEWCRRAIVVWVGDGDPLAPPNIMVTRETRDPREELATYGLRKVLELAARRDFQLLGSGIAKLGDQPAFRALVRWSVERGTVTQALAWIASHGEETLAVTCTSIGEPSAFDELERFLASVRLRARESGMAPARGPTASSPPPQLDEGALHSAVPMPGTKPPRR